MFVGQLFAKLTRRCSVDTDEIQRNQQALVPEGITDDQRFSIQVMNSAFSWLVS